jgi:ABC-2 type transport system ATP-binding protein
LYSVTFDNVRKSFGSVHALDSASFNITRGSCTAILGPNGAGKSTSINIMLGILKSDGGEVEVLGTTPHEAMAKGRVGAMIQSNSGVGVPAQIRVGELISVMRKLYPRPLSYKEVIELSALEDLEARRTDRLSGGEAQRLSFALAILGDPELLFLDEPTVAMDVEARRGFWDVVSRLRERSKTIVFATHYLNEADEMADEIVVLAQGKKVASGSPQDIKSLVHRRFVRFKLDEDDVVDDLVAEISTWPSVLEVTTRDKELTVVATDSDLVVRQLFLRSVNFVGLEVKGVDLEEAFFTLTEGHMGVEVA